MTMSKQSFIIMGRAAPKGSYKPIKNRKTGRIMLIPQNGKTLNPWQRACNAVLCKHSGSFKDVPVKVTVAYYFKKTGKGTLSYDDPAPTRTQGDLDKLNRCIFDELTKADIIDDDKYITTEASKKRWSDKDYPYVLISIEEDDLV